VNNNYSSIIVGKNQMNFVTLYRPVGQKEMILVKESGWSRFPPRLEWQPIFYPVMNQQYAEQIAKQWNTEDEFSGYVGHVLAFEIPEEYISKYPIQNVGGELHNELWVPSSELEHLNNNINGLIRIVCSFYGAKYTWTGNGK
jgi:hypothetical protein